MNNFLFLIAFCGLGIIQSVDPYEELRHVGDAMNSKSSLLEYEMQILYFTSNNSQIPEEKLSVKIARKGNNVYMSSDYFEILAYGKHYIMINPEEKTIYLSEKQVVNRLDVVTSFINQAKSLENFNASCKFSGNQGLITFSAPKVSRSKFELTYDSDSYLVKSVNMIVDIDEDYIEFGKKSKMQVLFSDYNKSKNDFPYRLHDFLRYDGKKYHPSSRYRGYQVINEKK